MMGARTAKVLLFDGHEKPLRVIEKELPEDIEDGEMLCKILLAAICGSDVHTIDGRRKEPIPSILGHEGVAEVIISKRSGFNCGDRISFSVADSCMECVHCIHGLPQKCMLLFKYGHASLSNGSGLNGCYASHILLRRGTFAIVIPCMLSNKEVVPANCSLSTMVHALECIDTLGYYKPQTAFIQGAGLLGLYGCALLHHRGYKNIYCSDINQQRLEMVKEFGGMPVQGTPLLYVRSYLKHNSDTCGSSRSQIICIHRDSLTLLALEFKEIADCSVDVVIEACGSKEVIADGIRILRPGGVYILIGLIHPDSNMNLKAETLMRKSLTMRGIHNYSPHHLEAAINFLQSTKHKFPYDTLTDPKVYSLDQIDEALCSVRAQNYARVCIRP